ncbi:MAG: PAS domain S-box protein [Thermoanaerobaculia bacterium]|nr:PAS domain S-box protein [Thermoanaerobaculia bacterium]
MSDDPHHSRESDAALNRHLEASPIPTFIFERSGEEDFTLKALNSAASSIVPNISQLIGMKASEIFGSASAPQVLMMREAIREKRPVRQQLDYLGIISGELRHVDFSCAWIPPSTVIVHAIDLTAIHKTALDLRASESRYRTLADESADAILRVDAGGRFVDVSRRAVELTGFSRAELMQMTIAQLLPVGDFERDPLNMAALQRGERVIKERKVGRKDGTFFPAELHACLLADGSILATARDLSPVIQSREQARFHSELLQQVQDAVIAVDAETRVTFWNRHAEKLYQFREEEVLGRRLVDFHVPADRVEDTRRRFASLAQEGSWSGEFPALRKDGTVLPVYLTVSTLRDEEGTLRGFVGISRELNAGKRAEIALAASEARLRSLVDRAIDAIFTVDLNGAMTSINAAFETMTGWNASDVIGKNFEEFLHPDELQHGERRFQSVLKGATTSLTEFRIRDAHGSYIVVESTATPEFDGDRIVGLFGIARNVTERRVLEEERVALTERVTLLLQSVHEGIIEFNADGRCTFANPAAARMTGFTFAAMEGATLHDILHGKLAGREAHELENCLFGNHVFEPAAVQFEDSAIRAGWKVFPLLISGSPLIDVRGARGYVVTLLDLTERNALQEEIEKRERLSGLGRVAASIAHEFNNLLMAIQPFAEMIGRASDSPPVTRAAGHIQRAVRRGKAVTQEVLRFTRPIAPVLVPIDVQEWLESIAAELRAVVGRDVTLEYRVAADTSRVSGDRDQLTQVISNLVLNSAQAGAKNITIAVSNAPPGRRMVNALNLDALVRMTVQDDGPGIPQNVLRQIFEPFFSTKRGGTGLGLAIVHQLVRLQGGAIAAESGDEKGTTFEILLPSFAAKAEQQPAQIFQPLPASEIEIGRVLLVEDDESVASGISSLLESEGIAVRIASSGAAGMAELEESLPDAAILDVGLPDMTGIELFQKIRERWPFFPVVFSTGHGDENYARAVDTRAVEFLMKPYDLDTLLASLRSVIERSRRRLAGPLPDSREARR